MEHAKRIGKKLLYPPRWVLLCLAPLSFAAVLLVLVSQNTRGALAYGSYALSAYALTACIAAVPGAVRRMRKAVQANAAVQRAYHSPLGEKYRGDLAFRGNVSLYRGMMVNFCYVIFRLVAGIRYASVWFISMAAYYLVLGLLRAHLAFCYRRRTPALERRCYRQTAWLLFLLNLTMGGMIFQMVRTNSGYSYPGMMIYISAIYTFYITTVSIVGLVKYRRLGSPILSAAKVLNVISALMSLLGLQTAMIAQFSANDEAFRMRMNAITGGGVYCAVIVIAVAMLLRSRKIRKEGEAVEPLGE